MPDAPQQKVTELLQRWSAGDADALDEAFEVTAGKGAG